MGADAFGYKAGWLAALMMGATALPQAVFDAAQVFERIPRDPKLKPGFIDVSDSDGVYGYAVTPDSKLDALVQELRDERRGLTLVFVRTKRGADRLVKRLRSHDVTCANISRPRPKRLAWCSK